MSLAPAYETGETLYIHPTRPPAIRDYVLIELKTPPGDNRRLAILRRIEEQTDEIVTLRQYGARGGRHHLARSKILRMTKVLRDRELIAG